MRLLRNMLGLATAGLTVLGLAALVYAHTTDTSETTSNANLGDFWAVVLFGASAVCLAATATAAIASRSQDGRRVR